jgi:hypothetical protein
MGYRVLDSGFRINGSGLTVRRLKVRVEGLGFTI